MHVVGFGRSWLQRIDWQVLELGHAQIRNDDEIGGGSETPSGAPGLLQSAVHGLNTAELGGYELTKAAGLTSSWLIALF